MIGKWFWREWRTASLQIVWLALTLSVACVLALGSLSERVERSVNSQSREFLAGDRVLRSLRPIPEAWLNQAKQEPLQISQQLSFMTMAYAGDKLQLVSVKAADAAYPLFGELQTRPANLKPRPGSALVSARLLELLSLKVGQQIELGDGTFEIQGELVAEPDAGVNPFATAPRVLIHWQDIDRTGAIQPGSRLTYRTMFGGNEAALQRFDRYIAAHLQPEQRWITPTQSETAMGRSLQRAEQFLLLSALLALLLSVAAVAVAMGHYCRSRYEVVAVLKTLGAGKRALRKIVLGQWGMLLLLSALSGSLLGGLFEWGMLRVLAPVLPESLPPSGVMPWIWAMLTLILISLMIGARPYVQLLATRPLRVLRHDLLLPVWPLRYYLPILLAGFLVVLAWRVGFSPLWWSLLAGILLLALLLGGVAIGTVLILKRIQITSLPVRLAINRILGQKLSALIQLASFSFSFMLLALLWVLQGGLLERWQAQLPAESPNYFLLNIAPHEAQPVREFLQQQGITPRTFYPIVHARLTEIQGIKASERVPENSSGAEAIQRELNLTTDGDPAFAKSVIAGTWPPKVGEVSIEQRLAKQIGVKLGDELTFVSDTQPFQARISSLRQVNWESLQPNFYFIFPQKTLSGLPQTELTSFRLQGESTVLTQLNRHYPTLTLLDLSGMIQQLSDVLRQVSRTLEVMVYWVLASGVLLLLAQLQVGMLQRRQELVVYRVLGAGRVLLRNTLWVEFALLGAAAGIAAVIAAESMLWLLYQHWFEMEWHPTYWLWLGLPLVGMASLSWVGGLLGLQLLKGQVLAREQE